MKKLTPILNKFFRLFGYQLVKNETLERHHKERIEFMRQQVQEMAVENDFEEKTAIGKAHMNFYREKDEIHMTVFFKPLRVVTELKHPVKGYTRFQRNDISWHDMKRIFINPREHIGKGGHYLNLLQWTVKK